MTNRGDVKDRPPSRPDVLRDALLRSGDFLGLSARELGGIVGISASTVTRLRRGDTHLKPGSKTWERSRLFVKLVVGLGTLTGTDECAARQWLDTYNRDLDSVPREHIRGIIGLADTVAYVDQFVHRPFPAGQTAHACAVK